MTSAKAKRAALLARLDAVRAEQLPMHRRSFGLLTPKDMARREALDREEMKLILELAGRRWPVEPARKRATTQGVSP